MRLPTKMSHLSFHLRKASAHISQTPFFVGSGGLVNAELLVSATKQQVLELLATKHLFSDLQLSKCQAKLRIRAENLVESHTAAAGSPTHSPNSMKFIAMSAAIHEIHTLHESCSASVSSVSSISWVTTFFLRKMQFIWKQHGYTIDKT